MNFKLMPVIPLFMISGYGILMASTFTGLKLRENRLTEQHHNKYNYSTEELYDILS